MNLVDTDVLIEVQRGRPEALAWFAGLVDPPAVPGFVVMEMVQDARNAVELRQSLRLAAPLRVVWPTAADCERALSDFAGRHLSHGLGLLDALIGATAVGLSATLWTFNTRHYSAVPGLVASVPYSR